MYNIIEQTVKDREENMLINVYSHIPSIDSEFTIHSFIIPRIPEPSLEDINEAIEDKFNIKYICFEIKW